MTYLLAAAAVLGCAAFLAEAWREASAADALALDREAYARIARDARLDAEADAAVRALLDDLHLSVQSDA